MKRRTGQQLHDTSRSFNLTPVIDIVFLLIIFFTVVCRFIEAENFPVSVPQDCDAAETENNPETQLTTVTVMKRADETIAYAVGASQLDARSNDISGKLLELIEQSLTAVPGRRRIVSLRVDEDIEFAVAQHALAAIAASTATDIQMAVLDDSRPADRVDDASAIR